MGSLVVVLLLGLWASILLPGLVRARREAFPLNSVSTFERCMSMLAPAAGRARPAATPGRHVLVLRNASAVATDRGRGRVLRRRRALLLRLAAGTALAVPVAAVVGGWAWIALGIAAAVLLGYVGLLLQLRAVETERRRKVRHLSHSARREPAHRAPAREVSYDPGWDDEVWDEPALAPAVGERSGTVSVRRWHG